MKMSKNDRICLGGDPFNYLCECIDEKDLVFVYRTALITNLRVGIMSSINISGGKPFSSGVGSGRPPVSTKTNTRLFEFHLLYSTCIYCIRENVYSY